MAGDDLYKIMDRGNSVASFKAFYHTPTQAELDAAFTKAEQKFQKTIRLQKVPKSLQ